MRGNINLITQFFLEILQSLCKLVIFANLTRPAIPININDMKWKTFILYSCILYIYYIYIYMYMYIYINIFISIYTYTYTYYVRIICINIYTQFIRRFQAIPFFRNPPLEEYFPTPFSRYLFLLPSFLFQRLLRYFRQFSHPHATLSCPNPTNQISLV